MSRVALPEPENLDPFLREMHVNAREGDWSTKHVARAFSSHPRLLEDYLAFYYPWHSEPGLLGKRLKELVRLRIATFNGCQTCKAARLAPELISEAEVAGVDAAGSVPSYTPREQAALALAEAFVRDHFSIDDAYIAKLRDHFSEPELLELLMMTGQYVGFGRALAILQLESVTCTV
jgi:alkylhydroperoxidase family enzyme